MRNFFIKKLNSNESGYSGDSSHRRQRGNFILIPKDCYDFFPIHTTEKLNDVKIIYLFTPSNKLIARKYVWHNAKYFLGTNAAKDLTRGHDEKRLYRSNSLELDLNLDRDVFFIVSQKNDDSYYCFSVNSKDKNYNYLNQNFAPKGRRITAFITEDTILNQILLEKFPNENENEKIVFDDDVIETVKDEPNNPDYILSEKVFRELTLKAYDYKCAIKNNSLRFGDEVVLEAAHIKPKRKPVFGPNIPSNGLALSYDLHHMFDRGMWTLDDDCRIVVHPRIKDQEILYQYNKKMITPIETNSFYKPNLEYIKFHRDNEYGKFYKIQ